MSTARGCVGRRLRSGAAAAAAAALAVVAGCGGEPPGFDTPESVVWDPTADVWLVSNVNGAPLARDDNGYIARVRPDGAMQRRWIQGGQGGVTLHAPKGMALAGDVLWVADIDVLRRFDRRTGAPLGALAIPGATFLSDVACLADGTVFCSDSGLDAAFASTGTDAIWRIGPTGEPVALVKGTDLGQPNGIVARGDAVYVVSWRDGTFYMLDARGTRIDLGRAPTAQLDGLVRVEPPPSATGDAARPVWLATSWAGRCIYRFDLAGGCTALPVRLDEPADCGLDGKRRLLLVPLFGANRLHVEPL